MQSLLAYTPSIRAGLVIGGSKAELLKTSRKADRDAPCDQARMLDSVRLWVLHDAKPTNERRLALGLRPKPHLFFSKRFFYSLNSLLSQAVIYYTPSRSQSGVYSKVALDFSCV